MNKIAKIIVSCILIFCISLLAACSSNTNSGETSSSEPEVSSQDSVTSSETTSTTSSNTSSSLSEEQQAMQQYVPEGWKKQIETVNKMASGKFVFGVQSDIHHYDTTDETLCKNLVATSYFADYDCIAVLGDLTRGYSVEDIDSPENMIACMDDIVARYTTADCPALLTVGNHDDNHMWAQKHGSYSNLTDETDFYNHVFKPIKENNGDNMVLDGQNTYYYMDFPEDNVRVVVLNTSDEKYSEGYGDNHCISNEQLTWFVREALDTDKYVVVMSHIPLHSLSSKNPTGTVDNAIEVMQAVKGFVNEGGKFVGYFHGHMHERSIEIDDNGHFHMGFLDRANAGETVIIDLENKIVETVIMGNGETRSVRFN